MLIQEPVLCRTIPIIGSEKVERDFGSGVLKITPGHDPTDFEIGQAADLATINLLNDDGSLNGNAGSFEGLKRREAQAAVWKALEVRRRCWPQSLVVPCLNPGPYTFLPLVYDAPAQPVQGQQQPEQQCRQLVRGSEARGGPPASLSAHAAHAASSCTSLPLHPRSHAGSG